MALCDLTALAQDTQPWNRIDTKVILAIQCALMCDALNGIDPTSELDPMTLSERLNCFSVLSVNQLMGIWTILWAEFLEIAMSNVGSGGQIVYYTNDPNTELKKPLNVNLPALAYPDSNVGGTIFQWVVATQTWV